MEVKKNNLYIGLFGIVFCFFSSISFSFQNEKVEYTDCSHLGFEDPEGSTLTREEELELLDNDFEIALNRSEKCLKSAISSSASDIAAAGGGSGGGGHASSTGSGSGNGKNGAGEGSQGNQQSQQGTEKNQEKAVDNQRANSVKSKAHSDGKASKGASAVCDAVVHGLNSATTESEKLHFESLVKKYKC